jgi:hypothetical protein
MLAPFASLRMLTPDLLSVSHAPMCCCMLTAGILTAELQIVEWGDLKGAQSGLVSHLLLSYLFVVQLLTFGLGIDP